MGPSDERIATRLPRGGISHLKPSWLGGSGSTDGEGLKDLLVRFKSLEQWGSRDRDKERYPKVGKDIIAEVERIRQLT